ncbi:hypothetical protein G9272_41085 [Streptomyces asoensis]|uniref:Uncharacterized protein n=1 Tax=Streptomyces asoensis TaxID=249586 RepID=A0A6M4X6Q9_9ACTN|nr:hypothetical protein [Streptomyces asoensis]QJT05936.1 hypothetical protein G9272_41085 [Streptomyces asoensis]
MNDTSADPRTVPSPPNHLEELARAVAELHAAHGPFDDGPVLDDTRGDAPRDAATADGAVHVVAVVGERGRGRTTVARQLATTPARIIDAPPWGSPGALPDADVVVVVVAAGSPLGMSERQAVEASADRTGGAPVLVAVTRLDTLDEEERPTVLSYVQRRARTILPAIRVVPAGRTPDEGHDLRTEVAAALGMTTREARARRRLRVRMGEELALLGERATHEAALQAQRRQHREAQQAAAKAARAAGEERWADILATLTRRSAQEVTAAHTRIRAHRASLLQDVLAAHERGDPAAPNRVDLATRAILAQGRGQADAALAGSREEAVRQVHDRFRMDLAAFLAEPSDAAWTRAPEPAPAPATPPPGQRRYTAATVAAGASLTVVNLARGANVQAVGIAGLTSFLLALDHRERGKARAAAARDQADRIVAVMEEWTARCTDDGYTALLSGVCAAREQWRAEASPAAPADGDDAEEPDWSGVQGRVAELELVLRELNRGEYVQKGEVC